MSDYTFWEKVGMLVGGLCFAPVCAFWLLRFFVGLFEVGTESISDYDRYNQTAIQAAQAMRRGDDATCRRLMDSLGYIPGQPSPEARAALMEVTKYNGQGLYEERQ